MTTRVLVTGGSGFLAAHTIVALLAQGYEVAATVRSSSRADDARAALTRAGVDGDTVESVSFHVADLTRDDGWAEAVAGCRYVLHLASPFLRGRIGSEEEQVTPAREGTLRVLRVAREAGVARVVMTSSFAAVGYGGKQHVQSFDESDWTQVTARLLPAVKAKVLAERAAWEFVAEPESNPELVVINPTSILGPVLGRDPSAGVNVIERLLSGVMPGTPKLYYGVVDVRDLADLHLRAMTHPDAGGERFIASAGDPLSLHEMALIVRDHLGPAARGVPRLVMPNWFMRYCALGSGSLRRLLPLLGRIRRSSSNKASDILDWNPRPPETTIRDTADSLIDLGVVGKWRPAKRRN